MFDVGYTELVVGPILLGLITWGLWSFIRRATRK